MSKKKDLNAIAESWKEARRELGIDPPTAQDTIDRLVDSVSSGPYCGGELGKGILEALETKTDRTPPIKRGDWCVFWDERGIRWYIIKRFINCEARVFFSDDEACTYCCQLLSSFDPNNPVSIKVEDYDWEGGE